MHLEIVSTSVRANIKFIAGDQCKKALSIETDLQHDESELIRELHEIEPDADGIEIECFVDTTYKIDGTLGNRNCKCGYHRFKIARTPEEAAQLREYSIFECEPHPSLKEKVWIFSGFSRKRRPSR